MCLGLALPPESGVRIWVFPDLGVSTFTPVRPFQRAPYLRSTEADSSDVSGSEAQRGLCVLIEKAKS
jgi:hypothetical protein